MTCGIYCITNMVNGMQYVGQSINIEKRLYQHIYSKSSSEIHQAIEEYGVQNFKFEPLIECSPNELDEQEVKFIRLLGTYENGYNQTRGGKHHVFNVEYDYETYSELKEQLKSKNETIKSIKKKNTALQNEINILKSEITNLNDEKASLNTKNIYLQKCLKQVDDKKIKPLKQRIANLEKGSYNQLKNNNKKLKSENKELKFQNQIFRDKINASKKELPKSNIFYELLVEKGAVE